MVSANAKGALLMSAGRIAFVTNDALMKFLFADMSVFQAMFLRGMLAVPLIGAVACYQNSLSVRLSKADIGILLVRGAAQIGMAACFLLALSHMPMANVAAVMQAVPLALIMVAALVLGEVIGWRRWSAAIMGLIGVILIIRPGHADFNLYSLLAVAAVGFATVNDAVTRYLPTRIPALFAALFTAVAVCLFSGVMTAITAWTAFDSGQWLILLLCAVAVAGGYLLQVTTMRHGDLSFVAPFRYLGLVWAILLGVVIFAEWPDIWTWCGSLLIAVTGLYSFYREQAVRRVS